MPLEIRELHIKAKVVEQGGQAGASAGASSSSSSGNDKDAIIKECIEQVLQILKDKLER